MRIVAALFVDPKGTYIGLEGVDCWTPDRDARLYDGPYPAVAHPPCARWGRYWNGGPSARVKQKLGDDGGCCDAGFRAVRRYGGVLEHPEGSHAWRAFGIRRPPRSGGWISAGDSFGGWTCCVEQGHYGHRARKMTWLYVVRAELPVLHWGPSEAVITNRTPHDPSRRESRTGACQRMSKRERIATPPPFRDLLLSIARSVNR